MTGTGTSTQGSQHSVALSWNPSTSQVIGYNVYRRIGSSGSFTKVNSSLNASTSYTDASVQSGLTYDYVTTAIDASNVESAFSNQATAEIP
jgi:fibronectin type 3 domain-containing protein